VKTKTHCAFRVDIWDDIGASIVEHVAGVGDFEVAEATYRAAAARWQQRIILRQGIQVVPAVPKLWTIFGPAGRGTPGTNGRLARWENSRPPISPPRARPVTQGVVAISATPSSF
jgi:hypothetical protein